MTHAAAAQKEKTDPPKSEVLAVKKKDGSSQKKPVRAKVEALKKRKMTQGHAASAQKPWPSKVESKFADFKQMVSHALRPKSKITSLIQKYEGQSIGINCADSEEIKAGELVEANNEFISVIIKETKLKHSYPLKTILTIVEGEQDVEVGPPEKRVKFSVVIKVHPTVAV
ncbi:MAG: hypothetical protein JSW39_05805 [Desulfobacterales bacterium]|nr:MAG: hypothetical protein JSW39_05805 [Desulfobacterales bacterium]